MPVGIVLPILILFSTGLHAGDDYFVDYLYIEAGEGDSSGGHTAIQFAEEVFHYQYVDGFLRAVYENSEEFEYKYRKLGNRNIHVSRIAVSEETFHLLRDYFSHQYLVQTRQFKGLNLILADIALLQKLFESGKQNNPKTHFQFPVNGTALFVPPNQSADSVPATPLTGSLGFSQEIAAKYGSSYITDRIAGLKSELANLKLTHWDKRHLQFSQDRYPRLPYSIAEQFGDLLSKLAALDIIQSGASLSSEALVESTVPGFELNFQQVESLRKFRSDVQRDLLDLLSSTRPDWGYPLMVGLGRLRVLEKSIKTRQLVLLDTFRQDSKWVDPEEIEIYQESFEIFFNDARKNFESEKMQLSETSRLNEAAYSSLELWGNRYAELFHGLVEGKRMRIHDGDLTPIAAGKISVSVLPKAIESVDLSALHYLTNFADQYSDRLKVYYRYNLLTRNCVSEIFQNLELALASQPLDSKRLTDSANESDSRLAALGTGFRYTVPFISSQQVRKNLSVKAVRTLLSYRQGRLNEIYADENYLMAYLRESNTVTSTLYIRNPDDSFFLFFTDDNIFTRPVYGAFNTVAGLGQTLTGIFLSPIDGGDFFLAGLTGFFVSIPELAFVNLRKGSYRYLPFESWMEEQ